MTPSSISGWRGGGFLAAALGREDGWLFIGRLARSASSVKTWRASRDGFFERESAFRRGFLFAGWLYRIAGVLMSGAVYRTHGGSKRPGRGSADIESHRGGMVAA